MTTRQQQEALEYFRTHADEWRAKAGGTGTDDVNVIEQRNDYVLGVLDERAATRFFLDVGCGTGELACAAARRGTDATGLDYAPEMIALASEKARSEGLTCAQFVCASVFDFPLARGRYELISANGFIEYISQPELQAFFALVADALASGGSFVVGSRNRLFNLVSMNDFTLQEIESGSARSLLEEAVAWAQAAEVADLAGSGSCPLQPPDTEHARTGVDVATRFQYTPLQLMTLLRDRGLRTVDVYPVHIHGVTPAFKEAHPRIHASIANLLQTFARRNTQFLPHASTFMLHAVKEG